MNTESRAEFEAFISLPPHEKEISRFPDDGSSELAGLYGPAACAGGDNEVGFVNQAAAIDPRAFHHSKIELDPTHELPFISRKALKRVKNPLPAPEHCRYCGPRWSAFIGHHEEVYNGRSYGDWPYVYLCENCGAYVGLHPFTDIPLGTMADEGLRRARKNNKQRFNLMMKASGMKRGEAYEWLAGAMGIPVVECHWAWFEIEQCEKAGKLCSERGK